MYILKGGLATLDQFADALAIDESTVVIDLKKSDGFLSECLSKMTSNDTVITFNNVGTQVDIWRKIGMKLVNILVDHPVFYIEQISKAWYEKYYVACVDKTHVDFLNRIFEGCEKHFMFLPHGGIQKPQAEKDIDILYVGSFHSDEEIVFLPVPGVTDSEEFYEIIINYYENEKYATCHDAVTYYSKIKGMELTAEMLVTLSHYALCTVEWSFVKNRRTQLIEVLAESGFHIDICGSNVWEELALKYPDKINYRGYLSPDEALDLICRAKILLNDHPYFPEGAHERVFNGMMNRAVVMTNESRYLKERFKDEESVLFWDGMDYETLTEKIHKVMEDTELVCRIAEKAFELTKDDGWKSRYNSIFC